jgi:RNA polymerase sigma-70 factor (ECF subfamily)
MEPVRSLRSRHFVRSSEEAAMPAEILASGRPPGTPDALSFDDIFALSYRRLVVQLYGVTGNAAEAEDVVQEAFVRAAAAGPRFLAVTNHEAWLRTVAVNVQRSRWRTLRSFARVRERLAAPPTDLPGLEDRLDVIEALRALPEGQRQVVALHYLADLPVTEIAHTLGIAPGTVKSRLSRGREALALALAEEGRGDA